jgi:hypothetical protein
MPCPVNAGNSSHTHTTSPPFSRLMLVEIKRHTTNGHSSCPFGFCCARFMPMVETNKHLSSDSSLFSRISSVVFTAGGGSEADYCNSLLLLFPMCACRPGPFWGCVVLCHAGPPWYVAILLCRFSAFFSVPNNHNCSSLHARKKPVSQATYRILAAYSTARRCAR